MSTHSEGPLPTWKPVGDLGSGIYEAVDPGGRVWRLWLVDDSQPGDRQPRGYRLAPLADLANVKHVASHAGLYFALDMAGLHIAADAVRQDPAGAARQLGLNDPTSETEGPPPSA